MFENLTSRLSQAMRNLRGIGKLSEDNIAEALKEVRSALLSADVHFKVAREFIDKVKEECIGQEVVRSVTPGQMIVKIINDRLVDLLGEGSNELATARPLKIMLVGLHGAGKTTTAAKLGVHLRKKGLQPTLVACDVYRPAAIDQLEFLCQQNELSFFGDRNQKSVPKIGREGLKAAQNEGSSAIIWDTAGRLQIDDDLIQEIKDLRKVIQPDEVLLVADSALGQEAVNVARTFHEAVGLTGIVLTKLDGDAQGGAALSMKAITGVPIKFAGTGEKVSDLDTFHPDRMAGRILGMGDVVSLVEKAQESIDQEEAERMAQKMKRAELDLNDFLAQIQQMKKLGSLGSVMKMLPGMNEMEVGERENQQMKRTEAIIQSMTLKERSNPNLINGSRRVRIANGSGTKVTEVNALLKQFGQMRKMMKKLKGGKMKKLMKGMGGGGLPGMGGMGGGGGFPGLPGR